MLTFFSLSRKDRVRLPRKFAYDEFFIRLNCHKLTGCRKKCSLQTPQRKFSHEDFTPTSLSTMIVSDPPTRSLRLRKAALDGKKSISTLGFAVTNANAVRYGDLKDCFSHVAISNARTVDLFVIGGEEQRCLEKSVDELTGWECLEILGMRAKERKRFCGRYHLPLVQTPRVGG